MVYTMHGEEGGRPRWEGLNGGVWKGYCYYDTDTGIHIPAKEYQRRYVAMIDVSYRKCRRSLHHPEGEVVEEVGEKIFHQ